MELLRLYSNRQKLPNRLRDIRSEANIRRRARSTPATRQCQHRLDRTAIAQLVARYLGGSPIKDLATEFGVHRTTIATLLRRQRVELRQVGLNERQIEEACRLYRDGCSLAKLAGRFGVDNMTVRRYLTLAGVVMRSPNERRELGS